MEAAALRWAELEAEQPRLAELGRRKLAGPGVVLVATIRRDGTPRISPIEPLFWEGELWLSMGWGSLKARDVERDSRILVHSVVADRDGSNGEYKLRGRALPEPSEEVRAGFAAAVIDELGWTPQVGRFHLFRVDVEDIAFIRWVDATNDQFVTRWPECVEYVRRGTSDTSVGPREPVSELLD